MKVKDWTVMTEEDTKGHNYFYGPLDEYEPEDYEGLIKVPYEEWTSCDFAEILGDILEDRNHHWMRDLPHMLLEILAEAGLKESEKTMVMRKFTERLEKEKLR